MHECLVSYTFVLQGQQGFGSIIMTSDTPLTAKDLPAVEDIIRDRNHLPREMAVVVLAISRF